MSKEQMQCLSELTGYPMSELEKMDEDELWDLWMSDSIAHISPFEREYVNIGGEW